MSSAWQNAAHGHGWVAWLDEGGWERSLDTFSPMIPALAVEIAWEVRDPEISARRLAQVVGKDPILAVNVVRLANSAFSASATEITSLNEAVVRVGTRAVRQLVMAASLTARLRNPKTYGPNSRLMVDHCVGAGYLASLVAELNHEDPDAAFLYDPDERLVDQTTWLEGESPVGGSWGRIPNASGAFQTLVAPTPGAANVDNPASTCGNDVIEALEVCDATQFGDLTCASFGWGGGTLTCADECSRVAHDACTARDPGLVINEVESDEADRIELHNGTPATIDISGWVVSDSGGGSYTLPAATTLASGAYLVLERDVNHTFGLGDSDAVTLTDGGGTVVDSVGWSAGRAIPSYCRTPNGVGGFRTCDDQTFGNANF